MPVEQDHFVLYRNGRHYHCGSSRSTLEEIVLNNPDFTVKQGGKLPEWQIARYALTEVVDRGGGR